MPKKKEKRKKPHGNAGGCGSKREELTPEQQEIADRKVISWRTQELRAFYEN